MNKQTLIDTIDWKGKIYKIDQELVDGNLYYFVQVFEGEKRVDFEDTLTDQELAVFLYGHHIPLHLVNYRIMKLQQEVGKTDFLDYLNKKYE